LIYSVRTSINNGGNSLLPILDVYKPNYTVSCPRRSLLTTVSCVVRISCHSS